MDKLEEYLKDRREQTVDDSARLRRQIAYDLLKDALQHADLEPGLPLSETRLSKIIGISRTPVREALRQLAQEGLVEVIPGRAVTVASRTMRDVLNVVHLRLLLEPELVRLVAGSISPDQVAELQSVLERMETAVAGNDLAAWSQADTVFHRILSDACPNDLLGDLVLQMRNRVHYLASVDSQTNPRRLDACTAEHREIVVALVARNGAAAEAAMRDHISQLRESLFRRLSYS